MKDFEKQMTQYWMKEFPSVWSFLGSPEEAGKIPTEHKDQIHFLNDRGTELIEQFLESSKMTKGFPFKPFIDYFKRIDDFRITENCDTEIKKWLYNKGIPFSKYVFIDYDRSGHALMLTWKMILKYWEGIFFAEDILIFDSALQWGLFYYHGDQLWFGSEVIFKPKAEVQRTIEMNEILKSLSNANKGYEA
ncbi:hypothetical protein [Croceimicrobium sp.]|uniref:hypothetical protein n=1 Tax=Croceimicrobium sp. TaxID=2828340 RepID=UPI003BACC3FD